MANRQGTSRLVQLPSQASSWIRNVWTDVSFAELKQVRDALVHRRLARILHASWRTGASSQRIELRLGAKTLSVPYLVSQSRDIAKSYVSALLALLPVV